MKKAIIFFCVLLVVSLIATVCFAAATGTKLIKYTAEYLKENNIKEISGFDELAGMFEKFIKDKFDLDLNVHLGMGDDDVIDWNVNTDSDEVTESTEEITAVSEALTEAVSE